MLKILTKLEELILEIVYFLLPLIIVPLLVNTHELPKLIIFAYGFAILVIIKIVKNLLNKSLFFNFNLKNNISFLWLLLLGVWSLISSFISTPNKYDAFFVPGTSTIILLFVFYFITVASSTPKTKNKLINLLILSSSIASLIQIVAFAGLIKNVGIFFNTIGTPTTAICFLLIILPYSIQAMVKNQLISKRLTYFVSSLLIFISLFILSFSLYNQRNDIYLYPKNNVGWAVAIDTIKQNPLTGIGAGNFSESYSRYRPIITNSRPDWNIIHLTSSNFILNLTTEMGILGLVIFLLFFFSNIKKLKNIDVGTISSIFFLVLGLLIPFSYLLLFLLPILFGRNYSAEVENKNEYQKLSFISKLAFSFIILPPVIIGIYLLSKSLYSEYLFSNSYKQALQGNVNINTINSAISISPGIDRYHLLYSNISIAAAESIANKENASEKERGDIAILVQQAINEAKAAVNLNPRKSINWNNLGDVYQKISGFTQGADDFSIQSYSQAILLNPINPIYRIKLSEIYFKQAKYDQAIEILKLAILAKPDLARTHFALSEAYKKTKQYEKAINEMEIVVNLSQNNQQDLANAKKQLETLKSEVKTNKEITKDNPEEDKLPDNQF